MKDSDCIKESFDTALTFRRSSNVNGCATLRIHSVVLLIVSGRFRQYNEDGRLEILNNLWEE